MFECSEEAVRRLSTPPADLDSDELLTTIAAAQRLINQVTAAQLGLVAEFARRRPAPDIAQTSGG